MTATVKSAWARRLFHLVCIVYAASFGLPAYHGLGIVAFCYGAVLGWVGMFAWHANWVLWIGLILLLKARYHAAAITGVTATLLATRQIVSDLLGPHYDPVGVVQHSYGVGYYLWLASMVLLAGGAMAFSRIKVTPGVEPVAGIEVVGKGKKRLRFALLMVAIAGSLATVSLIVEARRDATYPVEGQVLLDGKPLADASVIFVSGEITRPPNYYAFAQTDRQGRFQLLHVEGRGGPDQRTSVDVPGAKPSAYKVVFSKRRPRMHLSHYFAEPVGFSEDVEPLPARYAKMDSTPFTVAVPHGGKRDFRFELTSNAEL